MRALSKISTVLAILWVLVASAQTPAPPAALPAGQILDRVPCSGDPSQSYALYLPSAYTPAKRWPVIYAFDPLARGKVPVRLFKDAAEKYGYIVAGSNNSRNFSPEESFKGATAMWADTHTRLSLDERQVYMTGFSGGARMAGMLAIRCVQCKVAGVIAQGAGYPMSGSPPPKDELLYFLAVGNEDFNWGEIISVARQREDAGEAYRLRVFSGPHQWAPAEIIEDAVEWIRLKAMQSGAQPVDKAFVASGLMHTQAQARDAEKDENISAQLSAYRSLVSDFQGLADVTEFSQKLDTVKKSPEFKKAQKREDQAIAEQRALVEKISAQFDELREATLDQRMDRRRALLDAMSGLKSQAQHAKSEDDRLIHVRATNDVWALGIEAGQGELANGHYDKADMLFRVMADASPAEPWPLLLLAETHTAMGDKKHAIKDLREAVKRGLKNADILEQDDGLKPLQGDEEFQKLLAELRPR